MTQIESVEPQNFVKAIAERHNLSRDCLLVKYIERKTKAATRGAKARRSLGNVYALLVLAEDAIEGRDEGSRFTDLLARMRALPFGTKLQNHPLDNRLNDEFARQMKVDRELLPVQFTTVGGQKARRISPQLLANGGTAPLSVAQFIVDAAREYIRLITEKQSTYLDEIEDIETPEELAEFLEEAFEPNSDARLFEIVAYVLLAEHYQGKAVWIGQTQADVKKVQLRLFRSGRTNANDGGIDFVLQPLGRIFQVTETLDFGKYFLDFEKVNRYPISFVVKVELVPADALAVIRRDALKSERYSAKQVDIFMGLFEEMITLTKLRQLLAEISWDQKSVARVKAELTLQFRLEYGLLD